MITVFLLAGVVSTVYGQVPRRYYDWSSTLETQKRSTVLGIETFAQESTGAATVAPSSALAQSPENFTQFNRYIVGGNLLPNNPFYFIKTFQETLQLTFTGGRESRTRMRLAIGGERLTEMEQLANLKSSAVSVAAKNYENVMNTVTQDLQGLDKTSQAAKDIFKQIEEETARHTIILEQVVIKVPDSAQDAIDRALQASWQGGDAVADISGRPALPSDMVDRIQAIKAQGLITEEEAVKLIAAKTRQEARREIEKYVQEGIVPEADFMRLNENVKNLYPDDFFKIHELKRLFELSKLEAEKPDDANLAKIQEFAKTYKSGDIIPQDMRKYWVPVVRLEELQNTLRPDLIDEALVRQNPALYQKFTQVVEVFKPRPEDLVYLNTMIAKTQADVNNLPPEYQRMYNLSKKYGAQCGEGQRWVDFPQGGGLCVKEGEDITRLDFPRTEDFARGKSCAGTIISVRGPGDVCSAYPSDCIPPGWTKTDTCVETVEEVEEVGKFNTIRPKPINCPSNAHYVPFIGTCIPNYTPVAGSGGGENNQGFVEAACPSGYHRNYGGGPCLPDYTITRTTTTTFTGFSLPPLTQTPGTYPSPLYPSGGQCPPGNHWVAEPINPAGGYCAPDNYIYSSTEKGSYPSSGPSPSGVPYPSSIYPSPISGGVPSSCQPPASGCGNNKYWDYGSCACRESGSYPSSCAYPSGGCGVDKYWDYGSCSCKSSSSGASSTSGTSQTSGTSSGTSSSGSSGSTSQPPSGYGSCPSGQTWNGSACMTTQSEPQPQPVQQSAPQPSTQEQTTQSAPPQQPPPQQSSPQEQTASAPVEQTPQSSCPSGQFWNGSTCMTGSQ